MRFLLFNLVVVGSLVYLFTQDKDGVYETVDRAYEGVGQVKEAASAAVERAGDFIERERAGSSRSADAEELAEKAGPDSAPEFGWKDIASPERFDEAKNDSDGDRNAGEKDASIAEPPAMEPSEIRVAERPVNTVPAPESVDVSPPGRDLKTAERSSKVPERREPTRKFAIAEGETMMTPKQRQRDLFTLAEEMELMFVRKVGE